MLQPKQKSLQEHLFQRIKEVLPPGMTLADVVSETLHLGQDSAYRRIRGETLLVLDEAEELCRQFGISLDGLFDLKNNSVIFHRTEVDTKSYDFTAYLNGIHHSLKHLEEFARKNILYLTKGIPLFHVFPFRALLAFRYYFWMRTTFEVPEMLQQKFSLHLLPADTETVGMSILSLYNKIPSVEIWSAESINSTLLQIDYCRDAGLMTAGQAYDVTDSLRQMLEHLQAQAEWGRKFLPAENPLSRKDNFQLFYNGLGLGNDIILTTHDSNKTVYVNNDVLDYLTCTDEMYCNKVYQKLQTIQHRSTLISSVGEKQRTLFFNSLYTKLHRRGLNDEKLDL